MQHRKFFVSLFVLVAMAITGLAFPQGSAQASGSQCVGFHDNGSGIAWRVNNGVMEICNNLSHDVQAEVRYVPTPGTGNSRSDWTNLAPGQTFGGIVLYNDCGQVDVFFRWDGGSALRGWGNDQICHTQTPTPQPTPTTPPVSPTPVTPSPVTPQPTTQPTPTAQPVTYTQPSTECLIHNSPLPVGEWILDGHRLETWEHLGERLSRVGPFRHGSWMQQGETRSYSFPEWNGTTMFAGWNVVNGVPHYNCWFTTPTPAPAPMIPEPGIGDVSDDGFEEIGSVQISGRTMPLYEGQVEDGQVQIARYGITQYQGQFWIHRAQDFGWFYMSEGDEISISTENGLSHYRLTGLSHTNGYEYTTNQLPDNIIGTCYTTGEQWSGVELYKLVRIFEGSRHLVLD